MPRKLFTALITCATWLSASAAWATIVQWNGLVDIDWTVDANWTGAPPADSNVAGNNRLNVNGATPLIYSAAQGNSSFLGDPAGTGRALVIGSGTLGSGTMVITGGTFSTVGAGVGDIISNSDNNTGQLIINGGTYLGTNAGTVIGFGPGVNRVGTLSVLAGSATIANLNLNSSLATVNLDGGTLAVNNITRGPFTTGIVNLNGGLLVARVNASSFITTDVNRINVRNGGARINSAGLSITIPKALVHSNISGDAAIDGGLTKLGAGTLTLTGTSDYTGPTSVTTGTLRINGTIAGSGATVYSGATLGGTGAINSTVTINDGAFSPGANNIESVVTGGLTFNNTSIFLYELNSTTFNGDLVVSAGLDINAVSTLSLVDTAPDILPLGSKLTLINYSGPWNGGAFAGYGDDSTFVLGANTWLINYNDVTGGSNFTSEQTQPHFVTITVVPESQPLLLVSLLTCVGTIIAIRRRRCCSREAI